MILQRLTQGVEGGSVAPGNNAETRCVCSKSVPLRRRTAFMTAGTRPSRVAADASSGVQQLDGRVGNRPAIDSHQPFDHAGFRSGDCLERGCLQLAVQNGERHAQADVRFVIE